MTWINIPEDIAALEVPPFDPEVFEDGEAWITYCYENGFYWAGDKEMQWSEEDQKFHNPDYNWKDHK